MQNQTQTQTQQVRQAFDYMGELSRVTAETIRRCNEVSLNMAHAALDEGGHICQELMNVPASHYWPLAEHFGRTQLDMLRAMADAQSSIARILGERVSANVDEVRSAVEQQANEIQQRTNEAQQAARGGKPGQEHVSTVHQQLHS